jgi:hypothetical protein
MVVGEFTASNINMEEDAREAEEKQRKSTLDLAKFRADVAAAEALAKSSPSQLQAGIDALLALEKTARLAEDITACKLACGAVLERCHAAGQWRLLEENATLLAKRRGQLKQATQHVVRVAMALLDTAPDKATQVSLIKALQAVTEGKIFVEIERARLTRRLARIKEADGDVAGAADELQEVAVVRCVPVSFIFSRLDQRSNTNNNTHPSQQPTKPTTPNTTTIKPNNRRRSAPWPRPRRSPTSSTRSGFAWPKGTTRARRSWRARCLLGRSWPRRARRRARSASRARRSRRRRR